jgi:molybdopterin converting factor small subunit
MKINVILFGQLTDITCTDSVMLEDVADTDALVQSLHQTYPALSQSKYLVAVDKTIIETNTILTDNCTVALLPPFSGG